MKKPTIIKMILCSIILVSGIFLFVHICDKNKKEFFKKQEILQDSILKDSIEIRHLPGQTHSCNTL